MTKVPTVIPIFLAKITAITSMPSIAPPKRMVRPLPIPEISPPNTLHKSRSVPAKGELTVTSNGRTLLIRYAPNE